jgi:hypothetical protein
VQRSAQARSSLFRVKGSRLDIYGLRFEFQNSGCGIWEYDQDYRLRFRIQSLGLGLGSRVGLGV